MNAHDHPQMCHHISALSVAVGLVFVASACDSASSVTTEPQQDQSLAQEMSPVDMGPVDMDSADMGSVDMSEPLPEPQDITEAYARLEIEGAELEGSYSLLSDGGVVLDAGASVTWRFEEGGAPVGAIINLAARGEVWRFEEGAVEVRVNNQRQRGRVWGDGRDQLHPLRVRYDEWPLEEPQSDAEHEGSFGVNAPPPKLTFTLSEPLMRLTLTAEEGGLTLQGLLVRGAHAPTSLDVLNSAQVIPSAPFEGVRVSFESCLPSLECDDGARLQALIDAQPTDQPLSVNLISDAYYAHTPVIIRRSAVHIQGEELEGGEGGEGGETHPTWTWSPLEGTGQSWAFQFRGAGPQGPPLPLLEALLAGERRVTVLGQLTLDQTSALEGSLRVRLGADDFGEIPPVCVDGRDVEREQRHQRQLFEAISAEELNSEGESTLTLARAPQLNIPLSAHPTLTPVNLLRDVSLSRLRLIAECPEAYEGDTQGRFTQASCANPDVIDDGAVLSLYTEGLTLSQLSATGFGKFSYDIRDSLGAMVRGCEMRAPSAYGEGGQGYGVHLIGATRSLILDLEVEQARHGVVVDFGSAESQVIGGRFAHMNQALLDVHGEASRDTLIRGASLSHSTLGVIIGGGGRQVHCNDGPRHHVQLTSLSSCGLAISASDYTPQSYLRSNSFSDNGSHVVGAFGASEVWVERNHFGEARVKPFTFSHADTQQVTFTRNLITAPCSAEEATVTILGAPTPTFEENLWCR